MASIDGKQHRTLALLLKALFGPRSFEPESIEAARRLGMDYLKHEVRLNDGRHLLLTDHGLAAVGEIDALLRQTDFGDGAEPWDISNAFRAVLSQRLSEDTPIEDPAELMPAVEAELKRMRRTYWFIAPVNGIEFAGIDQVRLGEMQLIKPSRHALEALGAKPSEDFGVEEMIGRAPCLVGKVFGTESFAKRAFEFRANIAIGVLAAVAAASYERGSTPFRITLEISAAGARAAARYAFWAEERPSVNWVRDISGHQPLVIDARMAEYLESVPYVRHALSLADGRPLSELEQALVRGLFWFSDAQRDTVPVMQLIKYWSCAEGFFSEKDAITKTVSEGVVSVLVFGVSLKTPKEFKPTVNRLTGLYDLRSSAVHGALHDHVSAEDIVTLSKFTGWMLLGIASLIAEAGYTELEQLRRETKRLANLMRKPGSGRPGSA